MTRHESDSLPEGFITGPWPVSPREYHADRIHVSNSALELFRRSVPLYHAYREGGAGKEANRPMVVGRALHDAVLLPPAFEVGYHIEDDPLLMIDRGIDPADPSGRPAGSEPLTGGEFDRVCAMRDALLAHATAGPMLRFAGSSEYAIRWLHPATGLPMKAMIDRLVSAGPIVELKTAHDPSPEAFAADVVAFGYHRKAALYVEGRREALSSDGQFLFVVVGSEPPHEVAIYHLKDADLAAAREENERLLRELRDCVDFDQWGSRLPQWPYALTLPQP